MLAALSSMLLLTTRHPDAVLVLLQAVFEGLLNEALVQKRDKAASISAASASQLRYLVLRNLANLLALEDATAPRALSLYAQALMLDKGDSAVWNHMGTLVGQLSLMHKRPSVSLLSVAGFCRL